ncbi:MAG: glycosyltransferase family 2 protein [Nitrospira sp. BO4]|jgi:glycosyltransferase involved in cell wall biosynthesis|nr:glycosyltransferase family 2 protein [Nitrospira sp. BO4]
MKTAVIVTTYNRPDALAAVLEGYCGQSDHDFGLVVADDGSKEETAEVVRQFARRAPFSLTHIWQEDRGFRAAAIRNRAVASTSADYIIFTDGDCVPSRHFVCAHKRLAEPGYFLGSNRVLLAAELTNRVVHERLLIHAWGGIEWVLSWSRREINRVLPLMTLPDGGFRKWSPDRWKGIKTCNLSVWRADLIRVNGLDESYEGWGLEDSDLIIRLLHAGVKHKNARFAATVFHLWHPEQDRMRLPTNQKRLDELLQSTAVRAAIGLDRHGGL